VTFIGEIIRAVQGGCCSEWVWHVVAKLPSALVQVWHRAGAILCWRCYNVSNVSSMTDEYEGTSRFPVGASCAKVGFVEVNLQPFGRESPMSEITRVGVDLKKSVIQGHAVNAAGKVITNKALPGGKFMHWWASLPAGCVIEARDKQRWSTARPISRVISPQNRMHMAQSPGRV